MNTAILAKVIGALIGAVTLSSCSLDLPIGQVGAGGNLLPKNSDPTMVLPDLPPVAHNSMSRNGPGYVEPISMEGLNDVGPTDYPVPTLPDDHVANHQPVRHQPPVQPRAPRTILHGDQDVHIYGTGIQTRATKMPPSGGYDPDHAYGF